MSGEEVSREEVIHSISLFVRAYELVNGECWDKETSLPNGIQSVSVQKPLLIQISMAKLTEVHLLPQTPILTHPPPITTYPLYIDELVHRQEGQDEQEDLGRIKYGIACG